MKVLARIPAMVSPDAIGTAPLAISHPVACEAVVERAERPVAQRGPRSRFPMTSVVVLATLAGIVWSLASWNDARRLERHRAERMAQRWDGTAETFPR